MVDRMEVVKGDDQELLLKEESEWGKRMSAARRWAVEAEVQNRNKVVAT